MIHYFEDGTWVNKSELKFICQKSDHIGGYKYYETRKGNYVKSFFGLCGSEKPDIEKPNQEDLEFINSHVKPIPENEY